MPTKRLRLAIRGVPGFLISLSIVIGLSAGENWLPRAIASALLLLAGLTILVPMILSRSFKCIGPRLLRSSVKTRVTIEILGRLVFLGLTIFVAPTLFWLCLDLYDLMERGYPIRIEAAVTCVPGGALWNWVCKDIGLQTADAKTARYNLFFHPPYPSEGQRYEVIILPKSKCVLSLQPLTPLQKRRDGTND
jgi:hypothetical protein